MVFLGCVVVVPGFAVVVVVVLVVGAFVVWVSVAVVADDVDFVGGGRSVHWSLNFAVFLYLSFLL